MPQAANVIVKGFQGPIEQLKLPEKSTKPIQLIHILTNTGCFATVCGSASWYRFVLNLRPLLGLPIVPVGSFLIGSLVFFTQVQEGAFALLY